MATASLKVPGVSSSKSVTAGLKPPQQVARLQQTPGQIALKTAAIQAAAKAANQARGAAAPAPTPTPVTSPIVGNAPADLTGLTPAQQQAYINYWSGYQTNVNALNRQASDASTQAQQSLAQNDATHTTNTETANNSMAARGLFNSSIRDGDLNDIDATHVMNQNTIGANLTSLLSTINDKLAQLNTGWGAEQGLMNTARITNSQAVVPPTGASQATTPQPRLPTATLAAHLPNNTVKGPSNPPASSNKSNQKVAAGLIGKQRAY